jgi:hypothetical protein
VIRNVIIHPTNDQPLLADLFEAPLPGDVGLRCTNLRLMNGKRPAFIEDSASVFFFPFAQIRFVEMLSAAMAGGDPAMAITSDGEAPRPGRPNVAEPEPEADLEIDEDFLRRIREV